MGDLLFNGESGTKPQTEARRYVYSVLAAIIDDDMKESGGWLRGGIDAEPDVRRLVKAVKAVRRELLRKAVPGKEPETA